MNKNTRKINLIRTKFSNYFSFDKEQEIFFTQDTKYSSTDSNWYLIKQGENKILPVTVFYGANASGKSNLMLLFRQLKDFLRNSKKVSSKLRGYHPFALNDKNEDKGSLIEFEFLLGCNNICYSLLFNSSAILLEKLCINKKVFYQNNKGKIIFSDSMLSEYVINEVRDTIKRKKDVLILELLAIKECKPYIDIYEIFDNSFMRFESIISNEDLLESLYNNKNQWEKISKWLHAADIGVSRFEIEKREKTPEKKKFERLLFEKLQSIPQFQTLDNSIDDFQENSYEYILKFYHIGENGKEYPLPYGVESSGTMAFFDILVKLYPAFLNGGLFFADEIDSSLHPLLVKILIQAFNNPKINKGGAQLICTTHNSSLLKKDVLRRDEIWFIEKDATGHSNVCPLSQFTNIRNNTDFEKWYLQGRFGGIPLGVKIENFEELMEE